MFDFTKLITPTRFLPLAALSLSVVACSSSTPTATTSPEASATPASAPATTAIATVEGTLSGAGASFPAPIYQRWFSEINKVNPKLQISYQSVGSGAGVKQTIAGTVDFGASDVAMKDDEITQVKKGIVMLPMTAGSIVMGYNLPGVTGLKLSRTTLIDILLGKITKWNDPAIVALNPDLKLPDQEIKVVYRSDGSGTTSVFTSHLSAISPDWKAGPGEGKTVQWPVGIGAKGNEGVTAQILQTQGALGYIEYGYAKQQNISMATLENKAGKFIEPNPDSAAKTLASVVLPENLRAFITDPEGPDSYPIVSYSWILAYKQYDDPNKAKAVKEMVNWSLTEGQKFAPELGYVPLPTEVVTKVKAAAETIK